MRGYQSRGSLSDLWGYQTGAGIRRTEVSDARRYGMRGGIRRALCQTHTGIRPTGGGMRRAANCRRAEPMYACQTRGSIERVEA